jgi:hypothetical protein
VCHIIELGPFEAVFLQDFIPHDKAGFIPVDDFELVLLFITKDKHGVIKG